jgi:hypothetical protein
MAIRPGALALLNRGFFADLGSMSFFEAREEIAAAV